MTILDMVSVHRLKGIRQIVFLFFWYWLPIKRVTVVTAISSFARDELLHHVSVDPSRIRVVHCPVSSAFKPVPKEFDSRNPVILQMGTKANKNIELVAKALEGIPCHLRIIGSVSDELAERLCRHKIVFSWASNLTDEEMVGEYRRCDMLVFASTYEGFGLPIVEAQATGRAVITSNVCSMPEVAGDAACLVNPFDVESIRQGILKVIGDASYRQELIRRGFENIKRFEAEIVAGQYVAIYEELMQVKREQQ